MATTTPTTPTTTTIRKKTQIFDKKKLFFFNFYLEILSVNKELFQIIFCSFSII